jgi:hypothetical protein
MEDWSVVLNAMPDWVAEFRIAIMQRPLLLNHKTVKKWDFYVKMAGRIWLQIFKVTVEHNHCWFPGKASIMVHILQPDLKGY